MTVRELGKREQSIYFAHTLMEFTMHQAPPKIIYKQNLKVLYVGGQMKSNAVTQSVIKDPEDKTEAQKDSITCFRPHSWQGVELFADCGKY